MRLAISSLAAILVLALTATPALSRPLAGSAASTAITGVVLDTTGGAIPGATVTLRGGAPARETVTDGTGRFVFATVPRGPVSITVTLDQFAPATVAVDRANPDVQVVLSPMSIAERIIVRGMHTPVTRIAAAMKTDTPLRDVPQAITVVSQALIAEQGMQSMADVVRYVPGVGMTQGEGNRDQAVFRGNASTADFYVDGVRDDVQYLRDLYNVDRVEALKGPNAMIFGRGGAGGVINRATRQADWTSVREATMQAGSFDNRRATLDLGQGLSDRTALRLTGVYEDSGSYRDGVQVTRYGANPTAAFTLPGNTVLRLGYEYFHDGRTADRGVPSFAGRPVASDRSTFFGDPHVSHTTATVNAVSAALERTFNNGVVVRNRTRVADYDKFYQNVYPGSVAASGTVVNLAGYNNATGRRNVFNQTDVLFSRTTGRVRHGLLAGAELGRQATDNFRNTGYFTGVSPTMTTLTAPVARPTVSVPVTFRQSATDTDNHSLATVGAVYVQDQIAWSSHVQTIVGVRYDRFEAEVLNNRTAITLASRDNLVSPRIGMVVKPVDAVSLYANYTLTYVPRAGEQLSSLSVTNQALDPEKFTNYEVGAKWDVRPALSLSSAVYRLERTNVVVPDPVDPTRAMLVDGQRTEGVEFGLDGRVTGAWTVMGAYAWQDGEITRTLSATAKAGAVLAQVPAHTFSIWNKYNVGRRWGVGAGVIHRSDMFTSTDNTVVLPAFTRVDGALFVSLSRHLRAQMNVENLLDTSYFPSASGNNNITPGSPRAVRVVLTTRF